MKIIFICPEYKNISWNLMKVLRVISKKDAYFLKEADKNL